MSNNKIIMESGIKYLFRNNLFIFNSTTILEYFQIILNR